MMKLSPLITAERIADALERTFATFDYPGFCVSCGADATGCSNMRGYACADCGKLSVYGAEEMITMNFG